MRKRIWILFCILAFLVLLGTLMGSGLSPSAYSLIKNAGSALTQRSTANCGSGLTCTDDAGNNWTNFALTTPVTVPLGGTGLTSLTANGVFIGNGAGTPTFALSSDNTKALCGGTPPAFGATCGGSGGGGSGAGLVTYAALSVVLSGGTTPVFVPFGGGGLGSTTETNVQTKVQPVGQTLNACVFLSAAPGAGNSLAVILRDGAMNQSVTMTISNTSTSACDSTHTFTNAAGDLMDWSLVPSGTIALFAPNVMIATQFGISAASGGYTTLQNISASLTQRTTLNFLNGLGCNDSGSISQCTGYLGAVPPTVASLTWVNQLSATTTTVNGVTTMIDSANEGGLHLLCQSVTPPYTITIQMDWNYTPVGSTFPYAAILAFRDSVSGKVEPIEIVGAGGATPVNTSYAVDQWTNATTFSTGILAGVNFNGSFKGFQVADDNTTNKTWSVSIDGSIYTAVKTEARTTFLTANQVCWGVRSNSTANQSEQMTLEGWQAH